LSFFELPIRIVEEQGRLSLLTPQGHLHSQRNPQQEAERFCANLPDGPLLFVGPGAGHCIPWLKDRADVFFFEPIPAVALLLQRRSDFPDVQKRYASTLPELISLLKQAGKSVQICIWPAYSRLFPGLPDIMISLLTGDAAARTRLHFERTWYRNALHHVDAAALSFVKQIQLKGLPVFLGAGPQLLADLRTLPPREKCVYIAADTALPYLLHRQIHPDFTLSIDGGRGTAFHLQMLPEKKMPTPVLTWMGGHPRLHDCFSEVLYYRSSFTWDQIALSGTTLPELNWRGGNVSGLFLSLVQLAGGKEAAFAGTHFSALTETHVPDTGYSLYHRLETRRTVRENRPAYLRHTEELRRQLLQNMEDKGIHTSSRANGAASIGWQTETIPTRLYQEALSRIPQGPPLFQLQKYYQVADIRKNKNSGRE